MAEQVLYGNFFSAVYWFITEVDLHYELAEVQKRNF